MAETIPETLSGTPVISAIPKTDADGGTLSDAERALIFKLYRENRLEYQKTFYRDRVKEFEFNANLTFTIGLLLTGISSILAAFNLTNSSRWLSIVVAILPALGALLVGFQQIYDWDRQRTLYDDAFKGLDELSSDVEDNPKDYQTALSNLISGTEAVLSAETDQWGRPIFDEDKKATQLSGDELLEEYRKRNNVDSKIIDDFKQRIQNGKVKAP